MDNSRQARPQSSRGTLICALGAVERDRYDQHGWVVLRKAVPEVDIMNLHASVERFRRERTHGHDEFGQGMRIGLLHSVEQDSLKVALNAHVRRFLAGGFEG